MLRFRVHLCIILLTIALMTVARTANATGSFRIVQISDSHIRATGLHCDHLQSVVGEINGLSTKPDFVISTGDSTDRGDEIEYKSYMDIMSGLTMPVYNAIGNHEVAWSSLGKTGYERFTHKKLYYSFDHKGVHFVSIDSTMWIEGNCFLDQQELTWLADDLKKIGKNMPVVLFYHHCPNYVLNEPDLLNVLRPYNVKLALVGHEHTWGTFIRNGIHFQLDSAVFEDDGNYRIVDFNDSEIRSYRKEVGKAPVADGVINLAPAKNPVKVVSPRSNSHKNGVFYVVAESVSPMQKMEIAIDGRYKPAAMLKDGKYEVSFGAGIVPGRHIVTARGTDSAGREWLHSIPITTGNMERETWRFMASGGIQRTVTVKDGLAFFGCIGGDVYCLDASNGKQAWKVNVGADVISEIAVDHGVAYFGVTDGTMCAVSAKAGTRLWSRKLGDYPLLASPVVLDGVIYTGGGNGAVYALNASDGKTIWSAPTGGMMQVVPLVCNGKVFFGRWDCHFYSLDAKTGSPAWTIDVGQWMNLSPARCNPARYGDNVVFTAFNYPATAPDTFCVDMNTGKQVWAYQAAPGETGCGENSPCISGNNVFVNTANGSLIKISAADGKEIWRSPIGQNCSTSSPVTAGGKVFSGGQSGLLRAFDEKTGKSAWAYSTGCGFIYGSPTYYNGTILIPSMDGSLTCVKSDAKSR